MDIQLGSYRCVFTPWRPENGRIFKMFSYDTETTSIDDERPSLTPSYVIGAACDGDKGVFISRDNVPAFFAAHKDVPFVMHNAAFDLKVTDALLKPGIDVYAAVDDGLIWDTQILKRLLSLATAGHTARGEASLADCARTHLGITLQKEQTGTDGKHVRTNFGQFLGRPPSTIPAAYLTYLAHDAIATWHLFQDLHRQIKNVLQGTTNVFGYVDDNWLKGVIRCYGPLTHHVQLKASIVMDVLKSNGIGIDQCRSGEKATKLQGTLEACKSRLAVRGVLVGERGSDKAMQSVMSRFKRDNPGVDLHKTATGKWSTAEEHLAELAPYDPFFADYCSYKAADKLRSTYLRKMARARLHPRFGYLLQTGRTYCSGGFNLQNLPREKGANCPTATVRGCFVPEAGNVFIDSDFSQIELVVLAHVMEQQLRQQSRLAQLVNSGRDVHKLIAATMLTKDANQVTKEERNSVKPVSFGRPGGMGTTGLQKVAKAGYGIDLTPEQVQQRIDAYHQLCPELDFFLKDEVDSGWVIAETLQMTPRQYNQALCQHSNPTDTDADCPQGWLGGMLLKVLREQLPVTSTGSRAYTQEEIDFFWDQAQQLTPQLNLKPDQVSKLQARQSDKDLWKVVRDWAGRRPVFTITGRLRANTTFCSSRNTLFQGPAADGAILALWLVWRAGYKLVDFVHDQLVIETPADDKVYDRITHLESLMKQGMLAVVPDMLVKVETVVTRSLNKDELDPRYLKPQERKELPHGNRTTAA